MFRTDDATRPFVTANTFCRATRQFEAAEALHMCHLILDSQRTDPWFYSPISEHAQNILDVGTGSGT